MRSALGKVKETKLGGGRGDCTAATKETSVHPLGGAVELGWPCRVALKNRGKMVAFILLYDSVTERGLPPGREHDLEAVSGRVLNVIYL